MNSMSGESLTVLRSFVAGANAQYRAAGLSEYQMRVDSRGRVSTPNRPPPEFRTPATTGAAASEQATAGAAAGTAPAGQAAPAAAAPPVVTDLKPVGADSFSLTWKPVAGAAKYGIWQDGTLVGHVTNPAFGAQVAAGKTGTFQIDSVTASGARTAKTTALRVRRGTDGGAVTFEVPGAATAPTAPAAPAG